MELSQCYLECAKLDLSMRDENGKFKILTNKLARFEIKVLQISPTATPNIDDDYSISIKTERISNGVIRNMVLNTLLEHYS